MKNLITAIFSKATSSTLLTSVGNRMFFESAPEGTAYPYIVVSVVNGPIIRTFTEEYRVLRIQFSIYSATALDATEISTIYGYLKSLYDECSMSITSYHLVWCRETDLATMIEEHVTSSGTVEVQHWVAEYEIRASLD